MDTQKSHFPTPPTTVTYGIRTIKDLRKSSKVVHVPNRCIQRNKEKITEYFTSEVDPIICDCVTHLLKTRPENIPESMLKYFSGDKSQGSPAVGFEVEVGSSMKKIQEAQRFFLATRITPVVTSLVNKIVLHQPTAVVDFICDELRGVEHVRAVKDEKKLRAYTATTRPDDANSRAMESATASASSIARPITAPLSNSNSKADLSIVTAASAHTSHHNEIAAKVPDGVTSIPTSVTIPMQPMSVQIGIFGIDGAGTSSLLNAIQGDYETKTKPTLGFRPVSMMVNESLKVKFYDLGGAKKIREIWLQYYHDVHAVIFVLDSSATPEKMSEAVDAFASFASNSAVKGKPLLVLCNKQDVSVALGVDKVKELLNFPIDDTGSVQCIECTSTRPENTPENTYTDDRVDKGVEWLIEQLKTQFSTLDARVKSDLLVKEAEEKRKRLERERRVLKNKIASAFASKMNPALIPEGVTENLEDVFSKEEGDTFLASEIGVDILPEEAAAAAALAGYQRLALQMIGALNSPISKKKVPMPWPEIAEMLVEIRKELGI